MTRMIATNAAIVTALRILVFHLLERGNLRAATGQPAGPALASRQLSATTSMMASANAPGAS